MNSMHEQAREPTENRVACGDEAAVGRLAAAVAGGLPPQAVVTLQGDLGAGKTTFVKHLAAAIGIDPATVTSPTFGLIHLHQPPTRGEPHRLVHVDAYRLAGEEELEELGWEELLADGGWIIVEWPQRIAAALPPRRLEIAIAVSGPTSRVVTLRPLGGMRPVGL